MSEREEEETTHEEELPVWEENFQLATSFKDSEGKEVSELTLQEPDVDQLERLDQIKGETAKGRKLISLISGLSVKDVGKIKGRDAARIGKKVSDFFERSGLKAG